MKQQRTSAFSLVELTLAVGIATFCLITLFGLLPVAVLTNRNATSQTAATNIMAAVVSDLRATPKSNTTSAQFGITFGTNATLYFNGSGQFTTSPGANSRYQLDITFSQQSPTPTPPAVPTIYADLKVRWPPNVAQLSPAPVPSGSAEMLAAFDRN